MKKVAFVLLSIAFIACNNDGTTTIEIDSLKKDIDTTTNLIADSITNKTERFVDGVERRLDGDSTNRDSTRN